MKFVLLLAAFVALAAASTAQTSDEETTRESEPVKSRSEESSARVERRQRLVTRRERQNITRHPNEIVLLNGVQQCVLCRETWSEALNAFNADVNVDGVITPDKTCRFACRGEAMTKLNSMEDQEKNEFLCDSCRIGIDFWRDQPSKKTHYQLAKDRMCKSFTTQVTREDCEHTVRMYGFDIFTAIRNDVSSSSICHMYNLCGRQTIEFEWEEDEEKEDMEKDLESVSLDELVRAGSIVRGDSKESKKESTEATNSAEEDGVSISTERTSSEELERSMKQRRERGREARRERRRLERKERHERERAEQARRHAEERREESREEKEDSTEE